MSSAPYAHPYWFLLALLLNFFLLGLPASLLIDQLLRHEYEHHPDCWEADERPCGTFWCPPEADWVYSYTHNFFFYRWLFKTPDWVRSDRRCLRKLYAIRALIVCGYVATAVILLTLAL